VAVAVYHGEELGRYGFGHGHPFGTDRLGAFWNAVLEAGLERELQVLQPATAPEADIARFHTADYIRRVREQSASGQGFLDAGDTPAFPGVYEAAACVVGSDLDALGHIVSGAVPRILVPIAGLHHARRDSAAGFCVFNDIGVVIEALREHYGVRRIAYVDIDAHHGDGVFYAYEKDPDLVIADIHEDGRYLYPGTGAADETGLGVAVGTKLNLPLAPYSDDAEFERVWPQVEEFIAAAQPEMILLQAGADSIRDDPITHMMFTPGAHARAARSLCRIADEHCNGRLLVTGGGGYNRRNIAAAWTGVLRAMLE
jgi:acetoin utilization protein AcuC